MVKTLGFQCPGVDSNAAWSHMLQCGPKKRQREASGAWFSKGHRFRPSSSLCGGWWGGGVGAWKQGAGILHWENDSGKGSAGPLRLNYPKCVFVSIPGTGRVRWACASGQGGRTRGNGAWAHGCLIFNFKCFVFRYVDPLCLQTSVKSAPHKGVCAVISLYGNEGGPVDGTQSSRSSWPGRQGGQASAATRASHPRPSSPRPPALRARGSRCIALGTQ